MADLSNKKLFNQNSKTPTKLGAIRFRQERDRKLFSSDQYFLSEQAEWALKHNPKRKFGKYFYSSFYTIYEDGNMSSKSARNLSNQIQRLGEFTSIVVCLKPKEYMVFVRRRVK